MELTKRRRKWRCGQCWPFCCGCRRISENKPFVACLCRRNGGGAEYSAEFIVSTFLFGYSGEEGIGGLENAQGAGTEEAGVFSGNTTEFFFASVLLLRLRNVIYGVNYFLKEGMDMTDWLELGNALFTTDNIAEGGGNQSKKSFILYLFECFGASFPPHYDCQVGQILYEFSSHWLF